MMATHSSFIFTLSLILSTVVTQGTNKVEEFNFLMPEVRPTKPDTYLCHTLKMNPTADYIVGFRPHANMETSHHVLLYGCGEPGSKNAVWNCGEMASKDTQYGSGPTCKSSPSILYAWAMDAPKLDLPKGVAFKVGGDSDVQYLVMQIHYKNVEKFLPPKNQNDSSGLTLLMTKEEAKRRAGVYLLGTDGVIPRHSTVYMETACLYYNKFVLHPFAYRTHTHKLGKVVSGYVIHNGKWKEIGRKNPQLPQMFYNVTNPGLTINRGDILAARCTMKNEGTKDVYIGATHDDEMCNFYVMYYVDGHELPHQKYCFSQGPLSWNWRDFYFHRRLQLARAPNTISVEPESGTMYQQSILRDLPQNDKSDFSRKEQTLYNLLSQQQKVKTMPNDYLEDY